MSTRVACVVLHYSERPEHDELTYRAVETLNRALDFSLLTLPEVLVVDNGSAVPYKAEFGEDVLRLHSNIALASAFNRGMERFPDAERILLVTNDVVFPRFTVHELLTAASYEKVGIVAPMMDDAGAGVLFRSAPDPHKEVSLPEWEKFLIETMPTGNFVRAEHVDNTVLCLTRSFLDEVGMFDEYFDTTGSWYANQDWCKRAWAAGYLVGYSPRAFIHHCRAGTRGDYQTEADAAGRSRFDTKWLS